MADMAVARLRNDARDGALFSMRSADGTPVCRTSTLRNDHGVIAAEQGTSS